MAKLIVWLFNVIFVHVDDNQRLQMTASGHGPGPHLRRTYFKHNHFHYWSKFGLAIFLELFLLNTIKVLAINV